MRPFILAVLFLAPMLRAQNPTANTVTIDIENYVEYLEDVADPAKYASTNTLTPAVPLRNFIAVAGIAEIINEYGNVNVDFEDVRTVMGEPGKAMMGTAAAAGPDRAQHPPAP